MIKKQVSFMVAALLSPVLSMANPQGQVVVHGNASFTQSANQLTIHNSPNAIINWQNFNIQKNETTRFIQQNSQSTVLNRVIGQNPSQILGQLSSNGRVLVMNPNGIVFGANAIVDTQGFIASTLNLGDEDFLKGHYHFIAGANAGSVINQGFIRAGKDGNIILMAPDIENSGIISTDGGQIILAAAEELTITSLESPDIQFQLQAPDNEILNLGSVLTEGGAANLFAGTISHSGELSANSVQIDKQGNIQLVAQADITLEQGSLIQAKEIAVKSEQGITSVHGELVAAILPINQGGKIQLLGERVGVFEGADINASGENGGGEILIGGDFQGNNSAVKHAQATYVAENTFINADATAAGNGGKIIIWSDGSTKVYGSLSAKAGEQSGNGGLIETSGHYLDVTGIDIDASAKKGVSGEWLLDPINIEIVASESVGGRFGDDNIWQAILTEGESVSSILNTDIESRLDAGTNVTIATTSTDDFAGNITVKANITKNTGDEATLLLKADNSIIMDNAVNIESNFNKLNIILNADADNNGQGNIQLTNFNTIRSNSGNIILGAGTCDISGCSHYATGINGNSEAEASGVYLFSTFFNALGGNINIKGKGFNGGAVDNAYGIYMGAASLQANSEGDIRLSGIGGESSLSEGNNGIRSFFTTLSLKNGDINLEGLKNSGDNIGISGRDDFLATETGNISINSTGDFTVPRVNANHIEITSTEGVHFNKEVKGYTDVVINSQGEVTQSDLGVIETPYLQLEGEATDIKLDTLNNKVHRLTGLVKSINFMGFGVDNSEELIIDGLLVDNNIFIDNFGEIGIVGRVESKFSDFVIETHVNKLFLIDDDLSMTGHLFVENNHLSDDSYKGSKGQLIAVNGNIILNGLEIVDEISNFDPIREVRNQQDIFDNIISDNEESDDDLITIADDEEFECN